MFLLTLFEDPMHFTAIVLIIVFSVSFHELFHALAATSQGDDTAKNAGRLTLNPFAHMTGTAMVFLVLAGVTWGQTPVNPAKFRYPFSDALVSFAGPFANLLLLAASVLVLAIFFEGGPSGSGTVNILMMIAYLNAFLFLLNMLPVPPLDGYGILETFLPFLRRYTQTVSQYGFAVLMLLFFVLHAGRWLSGAAFELVRLTLSGARNLL